MTSKRSFSNMKRLISDSPEPAPPLNKGEPDKTMAARPPPFSGSSNLEIRFCKKSIEPSLTLGKPAPKRPSKPFSLCSRCTASASLFQVIPNGGLEHW